MKNALLVFLVVLAALGLHRGARAEGSTAESTHPCPDAHQLDVGGQQYLACRHELIVRATDSAATLLERRVAPAPIMGLFERAGEVFVEWRP